MARDNGYLTFEGEVRHRTEKAVLFYVEDLSEEIWFPLSQCDLNSDETEIVCPLWLARAKGID